jgi:hypothetical protein
MKFTILLASLLVNARSQTECARYDQEFSKLRARVESNELTLENLALTTQKQEDAINKSKQTRASEIEALKAQIDAAEAANAELVHGLQGLKQLSANFDASRVNPSFNSVKLGRWVIQPESDVALVIRDLTTGGDKRYAFYNGGHSDMYTAGTGGEIVVSRLTFPSRWTIGEESTFLVVRDKTTTSTGKDSRYALFASKYVDL